MTKIPISAAKEIADKYGFEQVVIFARKTGEGGTEHLTTFGVTPTHCRIAAKMADVLKTFMRWDVQ